MRKELINHFTWLVNRLSVLNTYDWSADYKQKQLEESFEAFYKSLWKTENIPLIDLSEMTVETALELRFQKWDSDSNLYLIPLWFKPLIPIGIELTCINGEKIVYDGNNIDDDIRFGCLAYGIEITEEHKNDRT